jgi:hypothetical protein
MDVPAPTPTFLAARLALLALRASIDQSTALAADRVLVDAATSPLSTNDAAQLLAARPKPLFCSAKARDGMLVVSCKTESEADEPRLQLHELEPHSRQTSDTCLRAARRRTWAMSTSRKRIEES